MKLMYKKNKEAVYLYNNREVRILFYMVMSSMMFLIFIVSSCKKLITIDPPIDKIASDAVYSTDNAAIAVLTGLYIKFSSANSASDNDAGLFGISKYAGLSADEFGLSSLATPKLKAYYSNDLSVLPPLSNGGEFWNQCYPYILSCNTAIEGLNASSSLTPTVKLQLLGEAKFIRALIYFYLVNAYGDLPLVITSNYEVNRLLPRSPKSQVYDLMIKDLKEAKALLSDKYLDINLKPYTTTVERTRPTKWAATALLARVYLYIGEYGNAETESSALINQSTLFSLVPLSNAFLKNSNEAIFQIQPVNSTWNTEDARLYVFGAAPVGGPSGSKPIYLSTSLIAAFEAGDNRKISWIGEFTDGTGKYNFANKYKIATAGIALSEYTMVLRIGEQYLIRAESRANQNNTVGAIADLNVLRARSRALPTAAIPDPLPDLKSSLSQSQVLDAILQERRVELFSEWGHRWFDLKRTKRVDAVMSIYSSVKGGSWDTHDQWYPIPFNDLQRNPNLEQTDGYN